MNQGQRNRRLEPNQILTLTHYSFRSYRLPLYIPSLPISPETNTSVTLVLTGALDAILCGVKSQAALALPISSGRGYILTWYGLQALETLILGFIVILATRKGSWNPVGYVGYEFFLAPETFGCVRGSGETVILDQLGSC